jgi:hypothetical protein
VHYRTARPRPSPTRIARIARNPAIVCPCAPARCMSLPRSRTSPRPPARVHTHMACLSSCHPPPCLGASAPSLPVRAWVIAFYCAIPPMSAPSPSRPDATRLVVHVHPPRHRLRSRRAHPWTAQMVLWLAKDDSSIPVNHAPSPQTSSICHIGDRES